MPDAPQPVSADLAGALAGSYRVDREIGRGGMATVYLAEDLKHHRAVALKVLAPAIAAVLGPERFLREIEIAARLSHPHILPLFDSGAAGATLYYVTPYIEGHSLRERQTRERQLPIDDAIRIAREVASALAYAHAQGIVHRDIKPENILLAGDAALVADFGIARALGRAEGATLTETGIVLGTPTYMAPEQSAGGEVDGRADLYSLGCVLYELLVGEPPFSGPNVQALQSRHALEPPPPLATRRPGLPEALERAVLMVLAKSPADRPATAARFAEILSVGQVGGTTPVATRADSGVPHNLPRARTGFIGRDRELAEGARLLGDARLLTLTGVGGSGKTRLALRLAETLLSNHPDGVWFVDLASLDAPELVAQQVASALGVKEEPGVDLVTALEHHLAGRRVLIVLDNCEHLLGACSEMADRLLAALPDLKLLATSREGLGIEGERLFAVRSLSLPAAGAPAAEAIATAEAVRLFVARAREADRDFALDDSNAGAVAEICRRLDGIPLAIELAAVRVRALSVEQIRAMLDDRFRLLTGGSRSALERHRTLRATVQWSYDHLAPDEQTLYVSLAVFAGGWTLPAAAALVGGDEFEVLDRLTRLIDKSLVLPERRPGGEVRYRMLETLRQFGQELLAASGRVETLRAAHLRHFADRVAGERAELRSAFPTAALARIEPDIDNLRLALTWAFDHDPAVAIELTRGLTRLWFRPGHYAEGRAWYGRILALAEGVEPARRAEILFRSGRLAFQQGDYDEAERSYRAEIAIHEATGTLNFEAQARTHLGNVFAYLGRYDEASAEHERAEQLFGEIDDPGGRGRLENAMGLTAYLTGNLAGARGRFERALATFRSLGELDRIQTVLGNLALVDVAEGNGPAARARIRECMAINRESENLYGIAHDLPALAAAFRLEGDHATAARLVGADDALLERIEAGLEALERVTYERVVGALRTELGEEAFAAARRAGRALSWQDVTELA